MKIYKFLFAIMVFTLVIGCSENQNTPEVNPLYETSNIDNLELEVNKQVITLEVPLTSASDTNYVQGNPPTKPEKTEIPKKTEIPEMPTTSIEYSPIRYGEKVDLYKELVALFDTDNFDCGCDEKLKNKLKKIKPPNKEEGESGYVPNDVIRNALYSPNAILFDRMGSSYLVHSFRYILSSGDTSKLIFAESSPTIQNFKEITFLENNPGVYDHFFYTLDCSGFLSGALTATAGVNNNSVKISAEAASKIDKSLLIIAGVMYSPLYQAYIGSGIFSNSDSLTIASRIELLEGILSSVPKHHHQDTKKILLNSNYRIVLTSNTGSSGFNGEARLGVNGGFGYALGRFDAEGGAGSTIDRVSRFTNYKTYLTELNVGSVPSDVTIESINEKINTLKADL